jgi:hypothetical protein
MRRPVLKWCGAAVLGSFIVHCSKRRTLSMLEFLGGGVQAKKTCKTLSWKKKKTANNGPTSTKKIYFGRKKYNQEKEERKSVE